MTSRFVHEFQTRPIDQWPGKLRASRKKAPFDSGWGTTMSLLDRELRMLGARGVVVMMALREDDIRLDGRPKANCRPSHPGVIVSFTNRKGAPMRFPCDMFDDWGDNLRAIALALEALRKVDRYGVTQNEEQYRGWQALPAPAADGFATVPDAARFLTGFLQIDMGELATKDQVERRIREAEFKSHPDRGGRPDDFKRVQEAKKVLLA